MPNSPSVLCDSHLVIFPSPVLPSLSGKRHLSCPASVYSTLYPRVLDGNALVKHRHSKSIDGSKSQCRDRTPLFDDSIFSVDNVWGTNLSDVTIVNTVTKYDTSGQGASDVVLVHAVVLEPARADATHGIQRMPRYTYYGLRE